MRSLAAWIAGFALVFTGHVAYAQAPPSPGRVVVGGVRVSPERVPQLVAMRAREASSPDSSHVAADVFGITSFSFHNLGPCEFMPRGAAEFGRVEAGECAQLQVLSGHAELFVGAEVHLPNGVLVDQITIFYRDTSAASNPSGGLWRVSTTGGLTPVQLTDPAAAFSGGDTSFTTNLATPHTVDNTTNKYSFLLSLARSPQTPDEEVALYRVQIRYRRQLSPAPGTPRFNDVPTGHPFFQVIEALAAAGITTGCSAAPPLYCPEDPLTRGQAAAFFSKALGLHFPD